MSHVGCTHRDNGAKHCSALLEDEHAKILFHEVNTCNVGRRYDSVGWGLLKREMKGWALEGRLDLLLESEDDGQDIELDVFQDTRYNRIRRCYFR